MSVENISDNHFRTFELCKSKQNLTQEIIQKSRDMCEEQNIIQNYRAMLRADVVLAISDIVNIGGSKLSKD